MSGFFNWKKSAVSLGLAVLAFYPLVHGDDYALHIINLCFLWAVVAASWDLIVGYAGVLSIANVGFFAMGGYVSAILAKSFGWHPMMGVMAAGLITMVIIVGLIGLPSLRLAGLYICLWSYMFVGIIPPVVARTPKWSGGTLGLGEIPTFFEGITRMGSYYINFAFFLVVSFIIYRTIHSKHGLAFKALRDSKDFAVSLGINIYREKLKIFALSAFLTGAAGGMYVHYTTGISPTILGSNTFITAVAMVLIGGIGRFPGSILGTFVIIFASEYLRVLGTWRLAAIGAAICLMTLYLPGGLMQVVDIIDKRVFNRKKPNMKTLEFIRRSGGVMD